MRKTVSFFAIAGIALVLTGCAMPDMSGPERKFGRGLNNVMEFPRGGELRRSYEQTAIFGHADTVYTTGFFHGFNRSLHRTGVGIYEIVTAPFPNGPGKDFGPIFLPENPVYPASYKPGVFADEMIATDKHVGFSGGDVAPHLPGSKFKVFEN
jgi:putative exosortase-associated protein (TIGR04073 family)